MTPNTKPLARLYLEIDGEEIETGSVCRADKLPRLGVEYPVLGKTVNEYYYQTPDGQQFRCESGDTVITRYWKWEHKS